MSNRTKQHEQILNEAFNLFRFNGSVFFKSSLASPWGIQLGADEAIRFHIALEGSISVGTLSNQYVQINQGEIAVVSSNLIHWLADKPDSEKTSQNEVLEACKLNSPLFQQGTISHKIICCRIALESGLTHPLLDKLPTLLPIKNLQDNDTIWPIIDLIEHNLEQQGSWQHPITDRLVEILFIHLITLALESEHGVKIMDALIADRRIFQTLNIIHNQPHRHWTVTALGEKVGMSKSTLNRQFLLSVGQTPMAYLTNLRLGKARTLLNNSSISFDDIAAMTGYSSGKSLNKAFSKHFGLNLTQQRKSTLS